MVSATDLAKRALVTLLNSLASVYAVVLGITRESPDGDVHRAYRKLSKKCQPDKGGKREHQQSLNVAFDIWQRAKRHGCKISRHGVAAMWSRLRISVVTFARRLRNHTFQAMHHAIL